MEGTGQAATHLAAGGGNEALELGATLQEMRIALKRDLDDVAEELRIRPGYLQAIEEGRFADLPGTTYALGFVRAYADALGLDPDDAARRFKAATGGATPQAHLILPAPVASGGLPTGAVLFAAAVLAVLAYGGWYVLSSQGKDPGGTVAALPGQIVAAVRDALPERPAQKSSSEVAVSLKPQPAPTPSPPPEAAAPASDAQQAAPASSTPAPSAAETAAAEQAETTEPVDEDEDTPPPPPEQVVSEVPPPVSPPTAPAGATAASPPRAAAPSAPPPQQAALPSPPPSTAPAAATEATRVALVAHADSWIELRDSSGAVVYSRVLRKDERYDIPDRSGLVMTTGNAGGLEVLVDGRDAPALGAMGAVKRDIVMDPDKLRAGTAVPPPPAPVAAQPAPPAAPAPTQPAPTATPAPSAETR